MENGDVADPEETEETEGGEAIDAEGRSANKKEFTAEEKKIFGNLEAAKKMFKSEYLAACQSLGLEPDADLDAETAHQIMTAINSIVDSST